MKHKNINQSFFSYGALIIKWFTLSSLYSPKAAVNVNLICYVCNF